MTSSFSFQRLKLLIYKQGTEQARFYKIAIPAITGILAFAYLFFITVHGRRLPDEYNRHIFIFGLYTFGVILASTTFQHIHPKNTGNYWLSLPASSLEKLLCALFYNTFLFTLIYVACFYLVKTVALQFTIPFNDPFRNYGVKTYGGIFKDMYMTRQALYILLAFFPVQAFFIAGSAWYAKNSFVKTSVAAVILFFLALLYQSFFPGLLGKDYLWRGDTFLLYDNTHSYWKEYSLPGWISGSVKALLLYGLVCCFWILTWFRLKEKQL